jgi:oligopeptide/dipeptide ABC transporter ATP-binding protein
MNPLLTVRDLTIEFVTRGGTAHVVDDLNIYVNEGEIVGLVGESGCGKTVTVKTILGILPKPAGKIVRGEIAFQGQDLLQMDSREFQKLRGKRFGLIPQDPMTFLNPVFTVETQMLDLWLFRGIPNIGLLGYLAKFRNTDQRSKARELAIGTLKKVNIPDPERVMRSYPFQLSGGMRQRVLIAIALMGSPSLIIADEPATALDVSVAEQINEILEERVREEKISVIYVTHDLGVARRLCDRIYVMYAGDIVETAGTRGFFAEPKHPYTHGLLRSVPRIQGEMSRGIEGAIPNYYNPPQGCRFHPRCPHVMEICREKKPDLLEASIGHYVACYLYSEKEKT